MRSADLAAYAHQELPFERLVEILNPARSLSRHPLFQVMLAFQNTPNASLELPDILVTREPLSTNAAKFDLSFSLDEQYSSDGTPKGIAGVIVYSSDLFEPGAVETLARRLVRLLEAVATDASQPIGRLELLAPQEREQILVEWNNTRRLYPTNVCLHELVEAQVERTPDAIAVVCEDESLTYREVNRRANQLAHRLRKLGVGPEVIVGLFAERSVEMVVGLLGYSQGRRCLFALGSDISTRAPGIHDRG